MNEPRFRFGCCVLNDLIYVSGGYNVDLEYEDSFSLEVFDPSSISWQRLEYMKTAKARHRMIGYNGNLYTFGRSLDPNNCIEIYRILDRAWISGIKMQGGLYEFAIAIIQQNTHKNN